MDKETFSEMDESTFTKATQILSTNEDWFYSKSPSPKRSFRMRSRKSKSRTKTHQDPYVLYKAR